MFVFADKGSVVAGFTCGRIVSPFQKHPRIVKRSQPKLKLVAVLCCAVLCCAVLCCAVLCCAVLCCAVSPYGYIPELSRKIVLVPNVVVNGGPASCCRTIGR